MRSKESQIKKKIIRDYIKEYSRSPSAEEIEKLYLRDSQKYEAVDRRSFLIADSDRLHRHEELSSDSENVKRSSVREDLEFLFRDFYEFVKLVQESLEIDVNLTNYSFNKLLLEQTRIDNLLFLYSSSNKFIYSYRENFNNLELYNTVDSQLKVSSNLLAIEDNQYTNISPEDYSLSFTNINKNVSRVSKGKLNDVKRIANKNFVYEVRSSEPTIVQNELIIDLHNDKNISEVNFKLPLARGSDLFYTVEYSLDGTNFLASEYVIVPAANNNNIRFTSNNIKKIKIRFTMNSGNEIDNNYYYELGLSDLLLKESTLRYPSGSCVLGPYYFYDRLGNLINFNKVSISSCSIVPDGTSLSYYVSTDNSTWYPIDYSEDFGNILVLDEKDLYDVGSLVDSSKSATAILSIADTDYLDQNDVVLNLSFISSLLPSFILSQFYLLCSYGSSSVNTDRGPVGWTIDDELNKVSTWLYVQERNGIEVDIGPRGAIVDGLVSKGVINLSPGFHYFETTKDNYQEITTSPTLLSDLKKADPLYPYNHKYIIEGYVVDDTSDNPYIGISHYGQKKKYVSPEYYASLTEDDIGYYDVFTHYLDNGRIFFKTKVDKTSSFWDNTNISINGITNTGLYDAIYVKIKLESDTNLSPVVNYFDLKVG